MTTNGLLRYGQPPVVLIAQGNLPGVYLKQLSYGHTTDRRNGKRRHKAHLGQLGMTYGLVRGTSGGGLDSFSARSFA